MNYPGSDLKFQVTTTQQDFQLTDDDFTIVIKDHYGRVRQALTKNDCFYDTDGRFYFVVENVRRGVYYAFFNGSYEDDDFDKQRRVFADIQELYRVGYRGGGCCGKAEASGGCQCEHKVQYQQVFEVSIDGEDYLRGSDGKYILTADDKRICFKNLKTQNIENMGKVRLDTMTAEEFKQFIEGENPNGDIDTVPEIIQAMKGQSDDEAQLGNLTDEDMEKWFDDDPTNDDPEEPDADGETDQGE